LIVTLATGTNTWIIHVCGEPVLKFDGLPISVTVVTAVIVAVPAAAPAVTVLFRVVLSVFRFATVDALVVHTVVVINSDNGSPVNGGAGAVAATGSVEPAATL
jgi:hypothetical protein